jgi:Family of unknown function (DUF5335)
MPQELKTTDPNREIPRNQWLTFLDQFSREHRAWLATIERGRRGSPASVEALECPLASVVPHIAGSRVARIEIRLQQDAHTREPIHIDAPASIRVDETPEGVVRSLDIVDDDGESTHVRFRVAPLPETLDGIVPGELPST